MTQAELEALPMDKQVAYWKGRMLIAIGESLKNLDKITGGSLLAKYPEVDWKGAKGARDIISHHYFTGV